MSRSTGGAMLRIIQGICQGLLHLRMLEIIHRDLKSMNIVIMTNFRACLCDFGFG